jgi:hypothetical protein
MKLSLLLWVAFCPVIGLAQQNRSADYGNAAITAARLTHDGSIVRAAGHVQVEIAGVVLEAGEGVLDRSRQTFELKGRVLLHLPAEPPFWTIRYGRGRAVVATEPITVTADGMSAKGGILRARGHVQIRKDLIVYQADSAEFYWSAAEGELEGNILVNGTVPAPNSFRRDPRGNFPPEIVR